MLFNNSLPHPQHPSDGPALVSARTSAPGELPGHAARRQVPVIGSERMEKLFREYSDMALPGLGATPDWLRHTFISWCVNDLGLALPKVQKIVGHRDIQPTMAYVHTSVDDILAVVGEADHAERGTAVRRWLFERPRAEAKEVSRDGFQAPLEMPVYK